MRQQAEEMRRMRMQREQWPYALYGAAPIHYEFEQLQGSPIPPTRTIHRWLVKAGLVVPRETTPPATSHFNLPIPSENVVNRRQQLDFKGPLYLRDADHKDSVIVLRDCWSHRCALRALESRAALNRVQFLAERWA